MCVGCPREGGGRVVSTDGIGAGVGATATVGVASTTVIGVVVEETGRGFAVVLVTRAVAGGTVDVLHTLGCDVISQGGLGRFVVTVMVAENIIQGT